MIVVIGVSIIIINVIRLLRNVEGFKDSDTETEENEKEPFDEESFDEELDRDDYLNKLEELNPKVLKAIQKLNSVNISDINEYINTMKNVIDP